MTQGTKERCPDCNGSNLLFKALVDANCNFNDWLQEYEEEVEALCEDCNEWCHPIQGTE